MPRNLGFRTATAAIDNTGTNPFGNGFWVATVDPKIWSQGSNEFEVYHISLKGPVGSQLEVWVDRSFYSTTPRGDVNEWDPKQPLEMRGGQTLYFYWNSAAAPTSSTAPIVTVWIREMPLV